MCLTARGLAITAMTMAFALPLTACGGSTATPPEAELSGRVLYATNGCGACHGQEGKGDGPIAKTLTPPPRDFRDGASFKNGVEPAAIAKTIAEGLKRDGGQMQAYAFLTESERLRLAEYVISLRETPAQGADHATPRKNP
jgi:mono/diheme cytochrome c family protein